MAVTSHHDQVEARVGRDRQNGRLDIPMVGARALDPRGEAMPRQMRRQSRRGGVRRLLRLKGAGAT